MNTKNKISLFLMLNLAVSSAAIAAETDIAMKGSVPTFIRDSQQPAAHPGLIAAASQASGHYVQLERIDLSPRARINLANSFTVNNPRVLSLATTSALPTHTTLGMNGVPVLDQGMHGTCATFANAAALDAVLGHSEYISELCNLDLGAYLESQDKNYPSGWDGTQNHIVLEQIQKFGTIPMSYQVAYGCGSPNKLEKAYPFKDKLDVGSGMTADDFTRHSEKIMDNISYTNILKSADAFEPTTNMDKVLRSVKQSLNDGHRVVFGTLLDVSGALDKLNGAAGKFHVENDTWVMVPQIIADIKHDMTETNPKKLLVNAGHAMVITAYDDNAVVTASDGKHKGVLTLRNSWSDKAGDKGEYYMTYDFFTKLVFEVIEIVPKAVN
jgi:hypothetical protein